MSQPGSAYTDRKAICGKHFLSLPKCYGAGRSRGMFTMYLTKDECLVASMLCKLRFVYFKPTSYFGVKLTSMAISFRFKLDFCDAVVFYQSTKRLKVVFFVTWKNCKLNRCNTKKNCRIFANVSQSCMIISYFGWCVSKCSS